MTQFKKLVDQFNTPGTLVVISSYPPKKGEAAKLNAVACYAGNLLKDWKSRKVVVLTEMTTGPELYREGNVLVYRCYDRDAFRLYWQLLGALHVFNRPRDVLVQFEFNMFGALVVTGCLPFFLMFLRLMKKRVVVVQHQVTASLVSLRGHIGLRVDSFRTWYLEALLRWFYRFLGLAAGRIIVHEEILKERLARFVFRGKIKVISHGLALSRNESQKSARKRLGLKQKDFVLLLFGYLTWYKGTDWLIKQVGLLAKKHPDWNLKLVVAGGPSATLAHKPHYQRFLKKVKDLARENRKVVLMTGFLPEKKVAAWFTAADLVVLPYRTMMSASGPLSFALRLGKPFVASRTLAGSLENEDVRQTLASLGLAKKEILFNLRPKGLERKINRLLVEPEVLANLTLFSKALGQKRSWERIVEQYEEALIFRPRLVRVVRFIQFIMKLIPRPSFRWVEKGLIINE